MPLLAHIGNIPVEEWLPFVAPVVVLYLVGRRAARKRAEQVGHIPTASEVLDEPTVDRILEQWARKHHRDLAERHVKIFYPPGPDGRSASELAQQTQSEQADIEALLDELGELGYLEHDEPGGKVWLTFEGYDVMSETESILLETVKRRDAAGAQVA
jgi:hypothetical protein